MCTVSFVSVNGHIIITSNRDENIQRPTAAAPDFEMQGQKKIIFPKDAKAGGTWFAACSNGAVAVLLNGAFEKHTAGILPRAGHHAEVIVDEDIVHVQTAMGLIGVRIRIARHEKFIPEFEFRTQKPKKAKQIKDEGTGKMRDETEGEPRARLREHSVLAGAVALAVHGSAN